MIEVWLFFPLSCYSKCRVFKVRFECKQLAERIGEIEKERDHLRQERHELNEQLLLRGMFFLDCSIKHRNFGNVGNQNKMKYIGQ